MTILEREDSLIYYEERGTGLPMLLLAPGGMHSEIGRWSRQAFDPLHSYEPHFRLIAMDQRNAGRSKGALDVSNPWGSYLDDQVALVDHLGVDRFYVYGCCIGCSYALKLIEHLGDRVIAGVLQQPVGDSGANRSVFESM